MGFLAARSMKKPFGDVGIFEVFGAHGTFWIKVTHLSAKDLKKTSGYGTCNFSEKDQNLVVDVVDGDRLLNALRSISDGA